MKKIILATLLLGVFSSHARPAARSGEMTGTRNLQCRRMAAAGGEGEVLVKDSLLLMLSYGMPVRGDYGKLVNEIAAKYGFRYFPVAGCVVTPGLVDSVRTENAKTDKIIAGRFGKNWRNDYDREVAEAIKMLRAKDEQESSTVKPG